MVHHAAGLRRLIRAEPENPHLSDSDVEGLLDDYTTVELGPADRAMLDYVHKLTLEPWAMVEADVHGLRRVGFEDGAILDICQVAAYYAFVNRLADGLGVELEGIHTAGGGAGDPESGA